MLTKNQHFVTIKLTEKCLKCFLSLPQNNRFLHQLNPCKQNYAKFILNNVKHIATYLPLIMYLCGKFSLTIYLVNFMNKLLLPLLLFISTLSFAQAGHSARKYALCEHFTQASCGPCADKNPAFQDFYDANADKIHHIAYHTSWPGVDPMNAANSTEVQTRVDTYNVLGVPDIWVNGTVEAQPDGIDGAVVDQTTASGSPVRLYVTETTVGDQRTATIRVKSFDAVPTGSYKIYAAVVERNVNYTNPPGSNGEKYFPNVFRKMLPNDQGETFTAAAIGQDVSFTYNYTLASNWDADEIYVIAFIQETNTNEVLNSGSSRDLLVDYTAETSPYAQVETGTLNQFDGTLTSYYDNAQIIAIDVQTDAPADWTGNLNIFGADIPLASTSFEFAGGSVNDFALKVTPGATFALATYRITFSSSDPNVPPVSYTYYVNNGITDLVLGNNTDYQDLYKTALQTAGAPRLGSITRADFSRAYNAGALASVKQIYYNVGWIFPGLTNETAATLATFMDNGGDLFIAGQDLGWDIFDTVSGAAHGTPETQAFYTNYMHASWIADGSGAESQLKAVATDEIYGTVANSTVIDVYAGNIYPDQIAPDANATAIFTYNTAAKVAGVRFNDDTHKVVYLGIGIEMIGNEAVRNDFMKRTYDWFHTDEFYSGINQAATQSFVCSPNPANQLVYVQIDSPNATTFVLTDLSGKTVAQQSNTFANNQLQINTQNLAQGTYLGYFANAKGQAVSATQKITVIH